MNTIIDIIALRKPRLEYTSPPICGLIFSGSSSGTFVIVSDNIVPTRAGVAAPSNPAITQSPTNFGCPLVSFSAPRGQLGFLIYEETTPTSGQFALISNTIPPGAIGVYSAGNYFTAPVDQFGVEGPHSGPTVVPGGIYTPVPIVTSPTAVSYNVYNGTTLVWTGVNPTRDAFEGCNCTNYEVQALSLEGTALSNPVFACAPALLGVSPSSMTFSGVNVGSSQQQSFTLMNIGPVAVQGSAMVTMNDITVVANQNYTIQPGQSILVTVQFAPTTVENLTGTITFTGAEPLSATINATSSCVPGTPLSPLAISGSFLFYSYQTPGRIGWVVSNSATNQVYKVNLANNTTLFNITPPGINGGGGTAQLDLTYNPTVGTQGGLVVQQLSGAHQRQLYDIGANSWGSVQNTPVDPGIITTTAVRPSDGMTMMTGYQGSLVSKLLVTDKTLTSALSNITSASEFGACCWSSAVNKFFICEQATANQGWFLDPNNLGAGLVAVGSSTPIGGGRFCKELPNGSGYIFVSGISNWAVWNPVTQTTVAGSSFGPLTATGLVYSPCSGLFYISTVSGVQTLNPNGWSTANIGPADAEHGILYDIINNLKYVGDTTTMQLITYNY